MKETRHWVESLAVGDRVFVDRLSVFGGNRLIDAVVTRVIKTRVTVRPKVGGPERQFLRRWPAREVGSSGYRCPQLVECTASACDRHDKMLRLARVDGLIKMMTIARPHFDDMTLDILEKTVEPFMSHEER